MNKTKIDWADMTWNPVTGCLHGCEYCYARKIAERFAGGGYGKDVCGFIGKYTDDAFKPPYDLSEPMLAKTKDDWYRTAPYPFGFEPTLHRYRLNEPARIKKPQNIFVCSMADLFGDWVPDERIQAVFDACQQAPQHRYLFLTKNPARLCSLANMKNLPVAQNYWYGTTITAKHSVRFPGRLQDNTFISIEPLMEMMDVGLGSFGAAKWIIVGAETGNRKGKVIPKKEWVENIVEAAGITHAAVFMKESLRSLMGDDFRQEFPWTGR